MPGVRVVTFSRLRRKAKTRISTERTTGQKRASASEASAIVVSAAEDCSRKPAARAAAASFRFRRQTCAAKATAAINPT